MMTKKVEISHRTIIFTVFFLLFLWFLYVIRDIILLFFVSLLVMTIFDPMVKKLESARIPRPVSILISYVLVFAVLGITVAGLIPPLVEETTSLAISLPSYLENLSVAPVVTDQLVTEVLTKLSSLPGQLLRVGVSLFSNVFAIITILIFAFYLLLSRERLDEQLGFFFGDERKKDLAKLMDELGIRLGGWARGQLLLMFLVGLANFIGLTLLGIPYALPLGLLAGILEVVPYLGPLIAAIPAVVIGFGTSAPAGVGVIILAFAVQQIEGSVLIPRIVQKSAGISPIVTLLALSIGGKLAGLTGVVISVPVVISLQVVLKRYLLRE